MRQTTARSRSGATSGAPNSELLIISKFSHSQRRLESSTSFHQVLGRTGSQPELVRRVTRSSQTGLLVTAVNGDGKADIVLQLADGSTYIALLNGSSFIRVGFLTGPENSVVKPLIGAVDKVACCHASRNVNESTTRNTSSGGHRRRICLETPRQCEGFYFSVGKSGCFDGCAS